MTTHTAPTARLTTVLDDRAAVLTARTGSGPRWAPVRGTTSSFALHELRQRRTP